MAKQTINIADKETLDAIKDKVFNGGKSIYFSGFNDEGFTKEFEDTPLGFNLPESDCLNVVPIVYRNKLHVFGLGDGLSHYVLENEEENKWVKIGNMPYEFLGGAAVVYNDEIHIFGSEFNYSSSSNTIYPYTSYHYKYDGEKWHLVSTYTGFHVTNRSTAVVYNNKIHVLCTVDSNGSNHSYHFSYNGSKYSSETNMPQNNNAANTIGSAVVYNDILYVFYYKSGSYWYQWTGSSWTSITPAPPSMCYSYRGYRAFVYNNELYYYATRYYMYKLNGTTWTSFNPARANLNGIISGNAVAEQYEMPIVFNDKIYIITVSAPYGRIFSIDSDIRLHYIGACPYSNNNYLTTDVVYNNCLYKFGINTNSLVIKWDGNEWISTGVSNPYADSFAIHVTNNGKVHMISGNDSSNYYLHYTYDGNTWTKETDMPKKINSDTMDKLISYKNELHLFYSSGDTQYKQIHYKFTGTEWIMVSKIPSEMFMVPFILNDKLYLSGKYIYNDAYNCWDPISTDMKINMYFSEFIETSSLLHVFRKDSDASYYHDIYNKKLDKVLSSKISNHSNFSKPIFFNGFIYKSHGTDFYKIADKFYHVYNAKLPAGIHIMFEDDTVVEPLDNCSLEDDGSLLTTATGLVRFRIMGRDDLPQYTIY